MKLKSIEIHNFRNLQNVVIKPSGINILTGRNGSGKTNFLRAIAHSLETEVFLGQYFEDNIVTYGPGKKTSKFTVELADLPIRYYPKTGDSNKKEYILDAYEKIVYQNIISAGTLSSNNQILSSYYVQEELLEDQDGAELGKAYKKLLKQLEKKISPKIEKWSPEKKPRIIQNENGNLEQIYGEENSSKDSPHWKLFSNLKNDILSNYIEKKSEDGIYEPEISSRAIYDFVTKIPKTQTAFEQILKRLKRKKGEYIKPDNFINSTFPLLLADIQRSDKSEEFKNDLKLYTDGLINNAYINTHGSGDENQLGNIGVPYISTPNAPKELASISMGSAILVFFITMKNWLNLDYTDRSYGVPSVMLFDEIDSFIHPLLLQNLKEVLFSISKKTQLFITTHSPIFIDLFEKENIYYIKPVEKIGKLSINRSDVFSYQQIIDILPEDEKKHFKDKKNSMLFVDGLIDDLYPIN